MEIRFEKLQLLPNDNKAWKNTILPNHNQVWENVDVTQ